MPVIINGSTGISGNDGSASVPTIQGTDANTGMFFPAADQIAFAEGGVEAMRLDASGNVGIGTTTPASKLHVSGSSGFQEVRVSSGSNLNALSVDGTNAYLGTSSNIPLLFSTNNTERARITSGGDFQFNSGYGSVATAFGCRAWVNFNGTGTVAIRASGGVSSITDNGVADYTVNLSITLPDTNYSVVGSARIDSSFQSVVSPTTYNTTSIRLKTSSIVFGAGNFYYAEMSNVLNNYDSSFVNIAIFR